MSKGGKEAVVATCWEVTLGALLHDLGKLVQRASPAGGIPRRVLERADDVLPKDKNGKPTHWHALWTDVFFDLVDEGYLPWPGGIDRAAVRDFAVYHHRPLQDYRVQPDRLACELVTQADRLAAGFERKQRDPGEEPDPVSPAGARGAFRRKPLEAMTTRISLSRGKSKTGFHLPALLEPDAIIPLASIDGEEVEQGYARAWQDFQEGWRDLCERCKGGDPMDIEAAVLSLSERVLWSVPSSTIDQPDVSLHDHSSAVAAFAAALFRYHVEQGDLGDVGALRDGDLRKFRFLVGDLSGLQTTLFRLKSEGVSGINRVLRGRSLRFQLIADAAVRRILSAFDMPMSAALQVAGGRFLVLLPNLGEEESKTRLDRFRKEADTWFAREYSGDLALGLALSDAFAPWDLASRPDERENPGDAEKRASTVREKLRVAIETAKLRQMQGPASDAVMYVTFPAGECPACGVRPAGGSTGEPLPCTACSAERELGRVLPRAKSVSIGEARGGGDEILGLGYTLNAGDGALGGAGWRWTRHPRAPGPAALQAGPAWVDRFSAGDRERYSDIEDASEIEEGYIKTFQALAQDARETVAGKKTKTGRAMLAAMKGDVDRLGEIFAFGLGDRWSIARAGQLSRSVDAYFSMRLPHVLETRFPESYTVYAGGDDFLLVMPWRQAFDLAKYLRKDFQDFAGGNPDLTFSLGIALFDPRTPISIAAREAEERLDAAKSAGRNRVCALEQGPLTWEEYAEALEAAERINSFIREGKLPVSAAYRFLGLDDARWRVAGGRARPEDYAWMAKLGYHLARSSRHVGGDKTGEVADTLRGLFGIGPDWRPLTKPRPGARLAISHALYRNR